MDFPADDPIEIIKHLVIGSEGTLGFVSQATYNTVPEWPHKASAFIVFPDVRAACQASSILRDETAVDAVELFDRCVCIQYVDVVGLWALCMSEIVVSAVLRCRG